MVEHISIHALREEGDLNAGQLIPFYVDISIHALREEGDAFGYQEAWAEYHFYPRPPRGGRPRLNTAILLYVEFLSTPSARRATNCQTHDKAVLRISIHALREEGDFAIPTTFRTAQNFYPRPPRGGRQQKQRQNLYFQTNYTTFCTNLEEL